MLKIAVLITCYNRKEQTLKCLASLQKAISTSKESIEHEIFLVDDKSTDGTAEEVKNQFPKINVINGTGNLFWARGMRLAWENALKKGVEFDSFLLLNDDVILTENFLDDMMLTNHFCLQEYKQSGIYVCSTIDPETSEISYGGKQLRKKVLFAKKKSVPLSESPIPCSMTNANILMVTKNVVDKIGIFDPYFIHSFADYDYTLTASKKGLPVLVCPGIGGYCINDHGNNWLSSKTPLTSRIKYLYSPKGLGYKQQVYYLWKHFKLQFPYYFAMLWIKTFFPMFWDRYKKSNA
jgi:GT2 family glycosyltransferase